MWSIVRSVFRSIFSATSKRPGALAALALVVSVLLTCGATGVSAQDVPAPPDVAPEVGAPVAAAPAPLVLEGTLSEYFIYLPQIAAPAGAVHFAVENIGRQRHNLRVLGTGIDQVTPTLRAGQSGSLDVLFVDPGPYTVYCDLADHADQGMTVTFVVEDPFTNP